ncbi:MAG: S41 family peptidase [Bacilli bacterium]
MKKSKNKKSINEVMENHIKSINIKINKRSNFKLYQLIIIGVFLVSIAIFSTVVVNDKVRNGDFITNKEVTSNEELDVIKEIYDLINNSYYKEVNKKELVNGAINGMITSLKDPHTSYFEKSEKENFNAVMSGAYEGIGAEIALNKNNEIFVFSVFKNSPAAESGLKFNDVILNVNGVSSKDKTTTEIVTMIKDPKIPVTKLTIKRGEETKKFEISKRLITIESVETSTYNISNKKIGYISINTFANNTYLQFRDKLKELEGSNIDSLIIDVRGNSGGYLHSVTQMLDMFLKKGTVCYQIVDQKTTSKHSSTTNESRNYPVVVLTNGGSASASEIMAIALKEEYGATIIGEKTYGKGTVQITKDLETGGMIKYTIQKWLSPKGKWINDVGVEPTIEVKLNEDYQTNPTPENDNQLQAAIKKLTE